MGAQSPTGTDFMVQAYAGRPDHRTPVGEAPAATLLQAQLGVFGVPQAALSSDLVISRTTSGRAVTAALELDTLAEMPAAIAAQPVGRSLALLTGAGIAAVCVCRDPAELAGDLRAARLLHHDRCPLLRPPWTFAE